MCWITLLVVILFSSNTYVAFGSEVQGVAHSNTINASTSKKDLTCEKVFEAYKCQEKIDKAGSSKGFLNCDDNDVNTVKLTYKCGFSFTLGAGIGYAALLAPQVTFPIIGGLATYAAIKNEEECYYNTEEKIQMARPLAALHGEEYASLMVKKLSCVDLNDLVIQTTKNHLGVIYQKQLAQERYEKEVLRRPNRQAQLDRMYPPEKRLLKENEKALLDVINKIKKEEENLKGTIQHVNENFRCMNFEEKTKLICSLLGGAKPSIAITKKVSAGRVIKGAGASRVSNVNATLEQILKQQADHLKKKGGHDQFAYSNYGKDNGLKNLSDLRSLGAKFEDLIVDPGIVSRLDTFKSFVRNRGLTTTDPWVARQKFSDYLGSTTFYRAVVVNPSTRSSISEVGFSSSSLRNHLSQNKSIESFNVRRNTDIGSDIKNHVTEKSLGNSPFISIGKDPEIAMIISHEYSGSRNIVLYRLRMPVLETITPNVRLLGQSNYKNFLNTTKTKVMTVFPKYRPSYKATYSPEVESFAFYHIDPSYIVSSKVVPKSQSGFYTNPGKIEEFCAGNCPPKVLRRLRRFYDSPD